MISIPWASTIADISASAGLGAAWLAACSILGNSLTSDALTRNTSGSARTQCTARSMAACSSSGSYQVVLVQIQKVQQGAVGSICCCLEKLSKR